MPWALLLLCLFAAAAGCYLHIQHYGLGLTYEKIQTMSTWANQCFWVPTDPPWYCWPATLSLLCMLCILDTSAISIAAMATSDASTVSIPAMTTSDEIEKTHYNPSDDTDYPSSLHSLVSSPPPSSPPSLNSSDEEDAMWMLEEPTWTGYLRWSPACYRVSNNWYTETTPVTLAEGRKKGKTYDWCHRGRVHEASAM